MAMKMEKKFKSESNSAELYRKLQRQRDYFAEGHTLSVSYRRENLQKLKCAVRQMEFEILEALHRDLGKSSSEGYMSEVGMVLEELTFMERNIKKWAGLRRVKTPIAQFSAKVSCSPAHMVLFWL